MQGSRIALAAFGLPSQPTLPSVGITMPKAPGLPKPASIPSPAAPAIAKTAFNVGMGASNSSDGAGGTSGEPADTERRQRSVIDRAFQRNEDDYATSSMPMPGAVVSP